MTGHEGERLDVVCIFVSIALSRDIPPLHDAVLQDLGFGSLLWSFPGI
jgi:hypothetical protein